MSCRLYTVKPLKTDTKNDYLAVELQYIRKTMILNGYPKSFIKKEIKKTFKKMENTPNNSNKEKTEGIAK